MTDRGIQDRSADFPTLATFGQLVGKVDELVHELQEFRWVWHGLLSAFLVVNGLDRLDHTGVSAP